MHYGTSGMSELSKTSTSRIVYWIFAAASTSMVLFILISMASFGHLSTTVLARKPLLLSYARGRSGLQLDMKRSLLRSPVPSPSPDRPGVQLKLTQPQLRSRLPSPSPDSPGVQLKVHSSQPPPQSPMPPPSPAESTLPYLLEWLHIPKTGTSFGNTLILWACPELDPTQLWQTAGKSNVPSSCAERFRKIASKMVAVGDHEELTTRTEAELRRVFTMIRSPGKQLLSLYHHFQRQRSAGAYNLNATEAEICSWLGKERAIAPQGMLTLYVAGKNWPAEVVAAQPDPRLREPTEAMVEEACRRLRVFAFTGITDYWDASVCVFHAQHGNTLHAVELENVQLGTYTASEESVKEVGCVHWSDRQLYSCALELFRQRLADHPQCKDRLTPAARLEFG